MTTQEETASVDEQTVHAQAPPVPPRAASPEISIEWPRETRPAATLRSYVRRVIAVDVAALAVVVATAQYALSRWKNVEIAYGALGWIVAASVFTLWGVSLAARGCYDARQIGTGVEEYKRITSATLIALAMVATVSFLANFDSSRGFVVVSLVLGLPLLLVGRFVNRNWLMRRRAEGSFLSRTLVIGRGRDADILADRLSADPTAGFAVVGRIEPPTAGKLAEEWLDEVEERLVGCDAVAVAEGAGIGSELVRRLAWRMEGPRVDLLVAPALSDLAGPRLILRPASGLPLIHLDEPQLNGPKRMVKRGVDFVASCLALVLLSPLFAVVALLIKVGSRGPVFFTQERVGQNGETFRFVKFRSMVVGAEDIRDEVLGTPDEDMPERYRADPRITGVGKFIRRWSIDELPQLANVLTGSMSMVGPRPLLVDELPLLADRDHRRHLTKPGLTGLWQVSGRKEVTWDERMRLDLWYVENWSPALDMVIVARTVRAVLGGHGAY